MVNFKILFKMYGEYLEKDILTTQELLSLGLNKNDLTKLVEEGKLVRPKKGKYVIGNAKGLLTFANVCFGKKVHNPELGRKALLKAIEIDPNNGSLQTRVFFNSIISNDFDQAVKSFEILDKIDNQYYKQDNNLWLYLLSFMGDLPEHYKERVREMTYDDIKVLPGDKRYSDKDLQHKIRKNIMNKSFRSASSMMKDVNGRDKKINLDIVEVLLGYATCNSIKVHSDLYRLINDQNYAAAKNILLSELSIHGLNKTDYILLTALSDLIGMRNEDKLPVVNQDSQDDTYSAVMAHDYVKAYNLNKEYIARGNARNSSSKALEKVLNEIKVEMTRLDRNINFNSNNGIDVKKVDKVGDRLFTELTICLTNQDIEEANSLINKYLAHLGKQDWKDYVNDLVQLSVLDNDKGFTRPMEALTDLAKDEFEFLSAVYIQDFYYNLARKQFYKAALYLDILSMSEKLGGIHINVAEMKSRLLEDAASVGISEADLGLTKKVLLTDSEKNALLPADKVLSVSDVMATVGESDEVTVSEEKKGVTNDGETLVPQEEIVVEEPSQVTYAVLDVVDRLLEDTNLIMLEPMSEEDIERVVETTTSFQKIQTYVLEEETGEKRVVLKYFDPNGPYVNFTGALRLANYKYRNGDFEEMIDIYHQLLPKLESPKSFIYARIAEGYDKLGDYEKAIDYYTVAEATSVASSDQVELNFTNRVNQLKAKCGYNGVVVADDDCQHCSKPVGKQYKNN